MQVAFPFQKGHQHLGSSQQFFLSQVTVRIVLWTVELLLLSGADMTMNRCGWQHVPCSVVPIIRYQQAFCNEATWPF